MATYGNARTPLAHLAQARQTAGTGATPIDLQAHEPPRPYGRFQQLGTGIVTCKPSSDCAKPVATCRPTIELTGRWLASAGFIAGRSFVIEVYQGMLIVALEPASLEEIKRD